MFYFNYIKMLDLLNFWNHKLDMFSITCNGGTQMRRPQCCFTNSTVSLSMDSISLWYADFSWEIALGCSLNSFANALATVMGTFVAIVKCFHHKNALTYGISWHFGKTCKKRKKYNLHKENSVISIVYFNNLNDLCAVVFELMQFLIGVYFSGHPVYDVQNAE